MEMPSHRPVRVSDVQATLGIQTDLTTGNWTSIAKMIEQLDYIGIGTVRISAPTPNNWTVQWGQTDMLAKAGIKFDFVVDTSQSPQTNITALEKFVVSYPNSVGLIEGPNEPNNWGVTYAGKSGTVGAAAWQSDFYAAAKQSAVLSQTQITGVASYPVMAVDSDINNLHVYAYNGDQPLQYLSAAIATQSLVDQGKGFVITEMGWYTDPTTRSGNWTGVDQATQAKLILNSYMDGISLGAKYIGLYSLRDWSGTDIGSKFGLFNAADVAKQSATALHNLNAIISDSGSESSSFKTGDINYAISAADDVHTLLMEKSNGEYLLALWREPDIWNEVLQQPKSVQGENVSIEFSTPKNIAVYDPISGYKALTTAESVNSVSSLVVDHPIFISLSAGSETLNTNLSGMSVTYVSAGSYSFNESQIGATFAGAGAFSVIGNDRDNTIIGGTGGGNTLRGGGGNDTIVALAGDNYIQGNSGNDTITVGVGMGGSGSSTIVASAGFNRVYGGADNDIITIFGAGHGSVNGNLGNDMLNDLGFGDNTIRGGQGDDTIVAGSGHCILMGDLGNDIIQIHGSAGEAATFGNSQHIDLITGGGGSDTFIFSAPGAGQAASLAGTIYYQEITDFEPGVDSIVLPINLVSANDLGQSTVVFANMHAAEVYALGQLIAGGGSHLVEAISVGSASNTFLMYSEPMNIATGQSEVAGLGIIHLSGLTVSQINYSDL